METSLAPIALPRAFRWLQFAVALLLAAAGIHLAHQTSRDRLALSGDEYYFYYAVAGDFRADRSDPVWAMRAALDAAEASVHAAAAGSASCAATLKPASDDLFQLKFLLHHETGGSDYALSAAMQAAALRAWEGVEKLVPAAGRSYAWQMGERVAATVALPLGLMIVLCFLAAAAGRPVTIVGALGIYFVLHAVVPPAQEAYWTLATQNLSSPWWIVSTATGLPFLNPRYSDSLLSMAPRGYLVVLFLLTLALRWSNRPRLAYVAAALLPLMHPSFGTTVFAMLAGADLAMRPRRFADPVVLACVAAALAFAGATGGAATVLNLAGNDPGKVAAAAAVLLSAAAACALVLPRLRGVRAVWSWADRQPILSDVVTFGPLFFGACGVIAVLHTQLGVLTAYGLTNLVMKTAGLAHHVFFFGLFCLVFTTAVAAIARWRGEKTAAFSVLGMCLAAAAAGVLLAPRSAGPPLPTRYALIAEAHDRLAAQAPLRLGHFETHLLWHRIVRQRETGGTWVTEAIDLTPLLAGCGGTGADHAGQSGEQKSSQENKKAKSR